ncbi:MAG: hypothetical protein R3F60_32470 [bacterium]
MRGGLVLLALLGGVLGTLAAFLVVFTTGAGLIVQPAPYRVRPRRAALALRLAMVHDVLHQRYPQHGPAWQRATISRARASSPPRAAAALDLATLDAFDDLAVALDRLGRPAEAIDVLRRKQSLTPWPEPSGEDHTPPGRPGTAPTPTWAPSSCTPTWARPWPATPAPWSPRGGASST